MNVVVVVEMSERLEGFVMVTWLMCMLSTEHLHQLMPSFAHRCYQQLRLLA
jgi:hypothetical protein